MNFEAVIFPFVEAAENTEEEVDATLCKDTYVSFLLYLFVLCFSSTL